MTEEQFAAILARTDAAVGLFMQLLIEKGIFTDYELSLALDRACDVASHMAGGAIVATVFAALKVWLESDRLAARPVGEAHGGLQH